MDTKNIKMNTTCTLTTFFNLCFLQHKSHIIHIKPYNPQTKLMEFNLIL